ncbi:MAG: DUF1559 domain-containing protein, partial [Blastopirellula sp. JB062]
SVIHGYFCPSRRHPLARGPANDAYCRLNAAGTLAQAPTYASIKRGLIDYAASNEEGSGMLSRTWEGADVCPPTAASGIKKNLLRLADATDGTSNTLLVAEKKVRPEDATNESVGDVIYPDKLGYAAGWDGSGTSKTFSNVRATTLAPLPDLRGEDGQQRFGSSHPGSFNALLLDGGVRSLPYVIDLEVFTNLGARSDGNPLHLE